MPDDIPLAKPDLGSAEETEVLEVLRSGRLALGPKTLEFERLLAGFTGAPWAAAVSSGTAGLHLAFRALGVGRDDCVVTTSFTFVASANAMDRRHEDRADLPGAPRHRARSVRLGARRRAPERGGGAG